MTKLTMSGYEKIMSDAADKMTELYDIIKRKDDELAALRSRVARLEAALKPFTADDLCEILGGNCDGEESVVFGRKDTELKIKHFRVARAALEAK